MKYLMKLIQTLFGETCYKMAPNQYKEKFISFKNLIKENPAGIKNMFLIYANNSEIARGFPNFKIKYAIH